MSDARFTLLPLAAQRVVPWRNGGGSTREVAVEPAADAACGFRWRVSIARVGRDGPFSSFPGVDRTLWLLRGAGMELVVDGAVHRLEGPFASAAFPGEAAVHARLLAGPTEDLNLMVDRARARAAAAVLPFAAAAEREWTAAHRRTALILALTGAVAVRSPDGHLAELGEGDALRADGEEGGAWLLRASPGSAVLCASFSFS